MELALQMCATVAEIKARMQSAYPELSFGLFGENRDYTLNVEGIDEYDAENICALFADVCYGDGELSLAETLVEFLTQKSLRLSVAESCTGGMLSSAIVDVEGASQIFYEGLITYANESKEERLGVMRETLYDHGAVSKETAIEMANGLLSNADIAVSVTGIAGPQGGTLQKPVGLVYIAVASKDRTDIYEHTFRGERKDIRTKAKNSALFYALKHAKNLIFD
ncbi:MAG: CinA family protein [Firmicutes bacterium]|nr:CinA family protein [Bacillota bacterium]